MTETFSENKDTFTFFSLSANVGYYPVSTGTNRQEYANVRISACCSQGIEIGGGGGWGGKNFFYKPKNFFPPVGAVPI